MGVIHHKTWRDLWENKGRTLQAVLIITIGTFAIGAIMGAADYISQDITRVWQSANPAMIGFWVEPRVDDTMLEALEHLPGDMGKDKYLWQGENQILDGVFNKYTILSESIR